MDNRSRDSSDVLGSSLPRCNFWRATRAWATMAATGGTAMFAAVLTAILLAQAASPVHDGSHDFDFEIGTWTIAVHREVHPLSGSHVWTDPAGYHHLVRKVWGGQASLAELELDKPAPHFLGLMLRLYDTKSGRWSVYWASSEGS